MLDSALLAGVKVLLTRQPDLNASLAVRIGQMAGESIDLPLFAIEPCYTAAQLDKLISNLDAFDLAIVNSKNAAQIMAPYMPNLANKLVWASVGMATAQYMQQHGVTQVVCPAAPYNSQSLWQHLQDLQLVKGRIVLLSGKAGSSWLENKLRTSIGSAFQLYELYRRVLPVYSPQLISEKLRASRPTVILITCVTSLQHLCSLAAQIGQHMQDMPLLVVSQRIYAQAKQLGFEHVINAGGTSERAILRALATTTIAPP